MESKQELIARARIYDQIDRASDHGLGHPGGPTGWRKPRALPATGNAAKLRRLRKEHPELHAKCMNGELTVSKASTMAGFYTPKPKPENNRSISRLQELELWLGPGRGGSTFADDDARRRAWFEHRDRLMGYWGNNGRRPQAWWRFEAPFKYPGSHLEKSTLWAAGLLAPAEQRQLEEDWFEVFNRSLQPDFIFLSLSGGEAHIAALVAEDVPAVLCERWAADAA